MIRVHPVRTEFRLFESLCLVDRHTANLEHEVLNRATEKRVQIVYIIDSSHISSSLHSSTPNCQCQHNHFHDDRLHWFERFGRTIVAAPILVGHNALGNMTGKIESGTSETCALSQLTDVNMTNLTDWEFDDEDLKTVK